MKRNKKHCLLAISLTFLAKYQVYSKTCIKQPLSKRPKLVFKTDYRLLKVKSITECSKWSILRFLTFIKLPVVIKTFILSILEWPFYIRPVGFTLQNPYF